MSRDDDARRNPAAGTGQPCRFAADGVTKAFGAATVLRGVDLSIGAGEVVAFMGANGAGKSTLVKIIAGVHPSSGGTMRLDGAPYVPTSPSDAQSKGVVVVHQAINDNVVLSMDVLENLMIERLCRGGSPFFRRSRWRGAAEAMAARVGLAVPLTRRVGDLSLADRQLVAIARALGHEPKLLILDEPTAALSDKEAERLFVVIEALKARGVPVLYISHRMSDIRRLATRVVTLRDGTVTGNFSPPLDYAACVTAMLGRALSRERRTRVEPGETVAELSRLRVTAAGPAVSLTLRAREVTAIVGLVGAGKTELAECLYGARAPAAGAMRLGGAPYAPASPRDAVRAGVHMASEDRAGASIVPDFDLSQNMTLPFTPAFSTAGLLSRPAERRHALGFIKRLGIVASGETAPIGTLSGGNQQKVVLARWLSKPCRLLILDEPFQGVDIAARRDIAASLRDTAEGRATLVLCSDLDEAIEVADRILVISHGAIVADHSIDALDREAIIRDLSKTDHAPSHAA